MISVMMNITALPSLSARRAWIEIYLKSVTALLSSVALRKESVDRNKKQLERINKELPSLSARRAWIEIQHYFCQNKHYQKSLSARRAWIEILG